MAKKNQKSEARIGGTSPEVDRPAHQKTAIEAVLADFEALKNQLWLAEAEAIRNPPTHFSGIRCLLSEGFPGKKAFASGATRSGRLDERYDLMSPEANRRRALTYGHGARAHGDRNWEKGMPVSECVNRAIRHLNLYLSGDTSEDHLAHAGVNLDFVMHFERHNPECLDIPLRRSPLTERTGR